METLAVAAAERTQSFVHHNQFEEQPLAVSERCLTEVDHLNCHRRPDGSHDEWTLGEVMKNLVTAAAEAAMPYMVTKTEHGYQKTGEIDEAGRPLRSYMWLGKTAVQNAASGRRYHKHPAALARVELEVDEALDAETNLRPGTTKIVISPRMSAADATHKVAKAEHLADDDSVRISRAISDEFGNIQKREMESVLVGSLPALYNFWQRPKHTPQPPTLTSLGLVGHVFTTHLPREIGPTLLSLSFELSRLPNSPSPSGSPSPLKFGLLEPGQPPPTVIFWRATYRFI